MRLIKELLASQNAKVMLVEVIDKLKRLNIDAVLREMVSVKSKLKVNILDEETNLSANAIKYAYRFGYEDCINDLFGIEEQINKYQADNKEAKPTFGASKILATRRINVPKEPKPK